MRFDVVSNHYCLDLKGWWVVPRSRTPAKKIKTFGRENATPDRSTSLVDPYTIDIIIGLATCTCAQLSAQTMWCALRVESSTV